MYENIPTSNVLAFCLYFSTKIFIAVVAQSVSVIIEGQINANLKTLQRYADENRTLYTGLYKFYFFDISWLISLRRILNEKKKHEHSNELLLPITSTKEKDMFRHEEYFINASDTIAFLNEVVLRVVFVIDEQSMTIRCI